MKGRIVPGGGLFGTNVRPVFRDMIQLKTIDQDLVPQKGSSERLIVVGDVHGCHDERTFHMSLLPAQKTHSTR